MKRHEIMINDLHALTLGFEPSFCRGNLERGDVHFNKAGSQKIAEHVADAVRKALHHKQQE